MSEFDKLMIDRMPEKGAILIKSLDSPEQTTPVAPKDPNRGFTLEELYALIGCDCVQIVRPLNDCFDDYVLVIDDEGKLKEDHIRNCGATYIYDIMERDYIAGNALFMRRKDIQ